MTAKAAVDRIAQAPKRRRCRCVHFTGTQTQICAAGVRYADVEKINSDPKAFPRQSLPCWIDDETFNSQNVAGKISCPNCKTGELQFRRAGAYNGHVHARCTTDQCTGWME